MSLGSDSFCFVCDAGGERCAFLSLGGRGIDVVTRTSFPHSETSHITYTYDTMRYCIMLYDARWYWMMFDRAIFYCARLFIVLYNAKLIYTMLHRTILYSMMLYDATLYDVILYPP